MRSVRPRPIQTVGGQCPIARVSVSILTGHLGRHLLGGGDGVFANLRSASAIGVKIIGHSGSALCKAGDVRSRNGAMTISARVGHVDVAHRSDGCAITTAKGGFLSR